MNHEILSWFWVVFFFTARYYGFNHKGLGLCHCQNSVRSVVIPMIFFVEIVGPKCSQRNLKNEGIHHPFQKCMGFITPCVRQPPAQHLVKLVNQPDYKMVAVWTSRVKFRYEILMFILWRYWK